MQVVATTDGGITMSTLTLAEQLFHAEERLLDAELRVEAELTRLYGGEWSGWNFSRALKSIDVFEAPDTGVDELFQLGFRTVVIHDHSGERFVRCACRHRSRSVQ